MKHLERLSNAEMGAAAIVMLAQLQDCRTEKQAQAHWNRIALLLRTQLIALRRGSIKRNSRLTEMSKHWQQDGSFYYMTVWETDDGI